MSTPHNHAPNFGRRVAECPRCAELSAGAPPIQWRGAQRKAQELARIAAIRAHDCRKAGCGPVCTFGGW